MRTTLTKKRILLATIDLLKTSGIKLTVKDIALHASCSAGAINYYFGSKANLISDAQESIANKIDIEDTLQKTRFPHYVIGGLNSYERENK